MIQFYRPRVGIVIMDKKFAERLYSWQVVEQEFDATLSVHGLSGWYIAGGKRCTCAFMYEKGSCGDCIRNYRVRNSFIFHHLKTMDEEVIHFNVAN